MSYPSYSDLLGCPGITVLPQLTDPTCPTRIGQIEKIAFQFIPASGTPSFATSTEINTVAKWNTLRTATDVTKVIFSAFTSNLKIPGSEAATGGGGNETKGGVTSLLGGKPIIVPFELRNVGADFADKLRTLASATAITPGETNLWIYLFGEGNYIWSGPTFQGIEIFNLFIGDASTEGFQTDTIWKGQFELKFGWSVGMLGTKATNFVPSKLVNA